MALSWLVVLAAAAALGPWTHAPESFDAAAKQDTPVAQTVIYKQDSEAL